MIRLFCRLFSLLPLWMMYAISSVLWPLMYYVVRYRREVVRRNLTESFPEWTPREIKRLERRFYRYFSDMLFESIKMATISPKTISRRMRFVNADEIEATLAQGRNVSLYLGHVGNWEWVSSLPLHLPHGVAAGQVYHRLRNRNFDRLLLESRERMGAVCVEMKDVVRRIGKFDIMGYIADQSPRREHIRHYVEFLNHRVPAYVGAEQLTRKYGAEAWFLDMRRVGRGRYEGRFVRLDGQTAATSEWGLTDLYYQHLEASVLRQPEIYLWTHKRFKYAERD